MDRKLFACSLSVNRIRLSGWCFQCLMETLRFLEIRGQKEWELKGSLQLRGGALGQLDREWGKKGQLCPEVSWIHCVQSEQWRTDKKNDLNKNSSAYAICKSFHKGWGRSEKSPHSVWCLGYRSLFTGLLCIPSLQIKARRGHLWRVTSTEGEGSSIPHPSPPDWLTKPPTTLWHRRTVIWRDMRMCEHTPVVSIMC